MYFKDLIKYRNAWLGVALIWIIAFHLPFDFGIFRNLIKNGYGGVDICFFASGIGCFYSLSSDHDILNFMKRRIKRIVPIYIVFIVGWLVYQYILGDFDFQMAIGNIFALQHFTGHEGSFNWYIGAIFLFYLLAPYFKAIVDRATTAKKILFLIFLFVCSIPFWRSTTHIITITRLPIFYIGMLFADACQKNKKISYKHILIMAVVFVLGVISLVACYTFARRYMWSHGLYWYSFALITPPLCMVISAVSAVLEKIKLTKPITYLLSLCGNYSFELYLLHIFLIAFIPLAIERFKLTEFSYLVWAIGGLILCVGCFILRRFPNWIRFIFCGREEK